jgi:NAD(P)-dependent dehydrogenase (short-subunit alcohol dehydrogenase family)
MLLESKNAVVYGGGGGVGGAVAHAFSREGATVFLAGRTMAPVEAVAKEIVSGGGAAEPAQVDALDEAAVEQHVAAVHEATGHIDVTFNAIGISPREVQGTPLIELSAARFEAPIAFFTRVNFVTATAVGRRMSAQGSGSILTLTATPARTATSLVGGMAPAWAAIEALTRALAAELGPQGVRVVCLRSHAIPQTAGRRGAKRHGIDIQAEAAHVKPRDMQSRMEAQTVLHRLPTLEEVANVATFLASDRASAMTATVANLSAGFIPE